MITISYGSDGKITFSDLAERKPKTCDSKGKSLIDFPDKWINMNKFVIGKVRAR